MFTRESLELLDREVLISLILSTQNNIEKKDTDVCPNCGCKGMHYCSGKPTLTTIDYRGHEHER